MNKEILEIAEKIKGLNDYGKRFLFTELFNKKIVQFPDISNAYVQSLQEERQRMDEKNSKLLLFVSGYCIHDNSSQGKHIRKYIYDIGGFTGKDGSIFGQMLEEEFSNIKNDTTT